MQREKRGKRAKHLDQEVDDKEPQEKDHSSNPVMVDTPVRSRSVMDTNVVLSVLRAILLTK